MRLRKVSLPLRGGLHNGGGARSIELSDHQQGVLPRGRCQPLQVVTGYGVPESRDTIKPRGDDLGLFKYSMSLSALLVILEVIPVDLLHALHIPLARQCEERGCWGCWRRLKLRLLSRSGLGSLYKGSHLKGVVVPITSLVRLVMMNHYVLSLGWHYMFGSRLCIWSLDVHIWIDVKILDGSTGLSSSKGVWGLISQSTLHGSNITLSGFGSHCTWNAYNKHTC